MLKVNSDNKAAGLETDNGKIPDNSEANHRAADVLDINSAEVAQPRLEPRLPVRDPIEKGVLSPVHGANKLQNASRYQILRTMRPILKYNKAKVNACEVVRAGVTFPVSSTAQSIDLGSALDPFTKLKKLYEAWRITDLMITFNNNNNPLFATGTFFVSYNQDPYRDNSGETDIRRSPDVTTIRSGFSKIWKPEITKQWLYSKEAGNKRMYSPGILSVIAGGELNNNLSGKELQYAITCTAKVEYTSPTIITDDATTYIYKPIITGISTWELAQIAPNTYLLECLVAQVGEPANTYELWSPIGYYFLTVNYSYKFGDVEFTAVDTIPIQDFVTFREGFADFAQFKINLPDAAKLKIPSGADVPVTVDTDATQMLLLEQGPQVRKDQ